MIEPMSARDLYNALKVLELRLIDANSEVSLSKPLDWLHTAIVHDVPVNLRFVPTLQEKLLIIEPEFRAVLHALIDDAKRLV
jgi:hypothetical protein